jgi:hypothetical protein
MDVMYQNGWNNIDILIHVKNMFFWNTSLKSLQIFMYFMPKFIWSIKLIIWTCNDESIKVSQCLGFKFNNIH